MSTVLVAETGRSTGSANARRMRREDHIPGVVYGQGMAPDHRDRRPPRPAHRPVGLGRPQHRARPRRSTARCTRRSSRTCSATRCAAPSPTSTSSRSTSTRRSSSRSRCASRARPRPSSSAGGLVDPAVDTIEVSTTPRNIPDEIVIDITDMTMDTVITLGDLTLPAGVTAGRPSPTSRSSPCSSRVARPTTRREGDAEGGELPRATPRPATPTLPASDRTRCPGRRPLNDGPVRPARRQGHPVRLAGRRAGQSGQGVRPHAPQRRRGVRPAARATPRRHAQGRT